MLTPLRWENDVSSQIGGRPQEIINEQIGEDYDIFIGILCNRFGQPTLEYESGTEEEFFRAYNRYENSKTNPQILFYFKDPRQSEMPIDAKQFLKVANFKEILKELGIYEDFDSRDALKQKVLAALVKALDRIEKSPNEASGHQVVSEDASACSSKGVIVPISEFDEDVGIMDLAEMVYDSIEVFKENMETMSVATGRLGERMRLRNEEINSIQSTGDPRKDQKNAKAMVEKVAAELQRYCHVLDQSTPNAKREFLSALRCMEHAIIISHQDGVESRSDIIKLTAEIEGLRTAVTTTYSQASNFRDALSKWPRMTSKLNQAKRRAINSLNDLLNFLSEALENIKTTLDAIAN